MRIAGVHLERSILVIRERESGKVTFFDFQALEELFNSQEIKSCDKIYINAGESNFLIKTKFFSNKIPEEAKNYVLHNLREFTVGRRKEYVVKVAAVPKEKGSNVYIIEGKKKQIHNRILNLPIEDYRITGVIPDNFAISFPFMLEERLDERLLIVEMGLEKLILSYLEDKIITYTRSTSFEKEQFVESLKGEMEILIHRADSVDRIYFIGDIPEENLGEIKREIPEYTDKIDEFYSPETLPDSAILAYGLSLTPLMGFDNDLTPEYITAKREERKKEAKFKKITSNIVYFLIILLSIPLFLVLAGEIWLFIFNRRIEELSSSYEKVDKIQQKVVKLKERLKLHEDVRTSIPLGTLLSELSRRIPDEVCLLELVSEPALKGDKKGFTFHLRGEGKTQKAVMQFYSKIQNMKILEETNLKKVSNEGGITSYEFTVILYPEGRYRF